MWKRLADRGEMGHVTACQRPANQIFIAHVKTLLPFPLQTNDTPE
jgi:hypothetical protein